MTINIDETIDIPINLEKDFAEIRKRPNGIYGGKNIEGEKIIVLLGNTGATVRTLQHNGWVQVSEYNHFGIKIDDYIDGRHH